MSFSSTKSGETRQMMRHHDSLQPCDASPSLIPTRRIFFQIRRQWNEMAFVGESAVSHGWKEATGEQQVCAKLENLYDMAPSVRAPEIEQQLGCRIHAKRPQMQGLSERPGAKGPKVRLPRCSSLPICRHQRWVVAAFIGPTVIQHAERWSS